MTEIFAPLRRAALFMTAFSIGVNLLMLTVPLYMLQLFDRVITTRSGDTLVLLTVMALGALIVLGGLDAARTRIMIAAGDWLDRRLSADVLLAALKRAQNNQAATAQGLRDLATVRGFVAGPGLLPLVDAPWVFIFTAVIFLISPLLGWIALGGALALLAIAALNELFTRPSLDAASTSLMTSLRQSDALVADADVVNAMGMARPMVAHWAAGQKKAWKDQMLASTLNGDMTALAKLLRMILQVGILGTGAWLATGGAITPGAMIAASIIAGRALAPVEQAVGGWRSFGMARAAWFRLTSQLDAAGLDKEAPVKMPHPAGSLTAEEVSYFAPGAPAPILRNVSFALAPGQALGIVGPSAAGKTTLARLLVGALRPSAGHIRLDGVEMADWDGDDKGRHVGYVPQSATLPPARVRDIIGRLETAEEGTLVKAAQLAGCHDLITALPQGYETVIGPGGVPLSGGERQRIALARAVYGNPRLLVMDEPNTNLDGPGEAALMHTIAQLKKAGTTIVMVAHRPNMLQHIDRLLVLNEGRVTHYGTRDEILPKITQSAAVQHIRPADRLS